MATNDIVTAILSGATILTTIILAIRQERINRRLKRLELRESRAFEIACEAGEKIAQLELELPNAIYCVQAQTESQGAFHNFQGTAESFRKLSLIAELHLELEIIPFFNKVNDELSDFIQFLYGHRFGQSDKNETRQAEERLLTTLKNLKIELRKVSQGVL